MDTPRRIDGGPRIGSVGALVSVMIFAGCATAENDPDGGGVDAAVAADSAGAVDAHTPADGGSDADGAVFDAAPPIDVAVPADAAPIDAATTPGTVVDDVAADFTGTGSEGSATVVESWGVVEPVAYYTGGLLCSGSDTGTFSDATTATWADVTAMPATSRQAFARYFDVDWTTLTPQGMGLTDADYWSLWYEGEIYLEAGTWTFYLLVDDHGFVELADSGTSSFSRVASANWDVEATGTFVAAAAGWYPIRLAVSEGEVNALFRLRFSGPGVASPTAIPRHRFRFRADARTGWFWGAWDDSNLLGYHQNQLDAVSPAFYDWADGYPADLGLGDADYFSTRWAGQFRIATAGDYTLQLTSDDGQRLWVDGAAVLSSWDYDTHVNTTGTLSLDAGWHDIVVDHQEATGAARAELIIASGPEGAGSAIPLARTRPVVARSERYETGYNRTDVVIPDYESAESTIDMVAPAGAVVRGIDVSYTFDHEYWGDLEFRLYAPSGAYTVLRDQEGGSSSGPATDRKYTTGLDGQAVAGTWRLHVEDWSYYDEGSLLDFQLTIHMNGGEPPIPTSSTFDAAIEDLGAMVYAFQQLSWTARTPSGSSVALRVRAGATEGDCLAAPWSAPLTDAGGSALPIAAARYFQYRIEFTSDGDAAPAVDRVQLDYLTSP